MAVIKSVYQLFVVLSKTSVNYEIKTEEFHIMVSEVFALKNIVKGKIPCTEGQGSIQFGAETVSRNNYDMLCN